jgi:hypothetical protein
MSPAPSPAAASPGQALARLGRRIGRPAPAPWSPPPLPTLIDRIDAALAARRGERP